MQFRRNVVHVYVSRNTNQQSSGNVHQLKYYCPCASALGCDRDSDRDRDRSKCSGIEASNWLCESYPHRMDIVHGHNNGHSCTHTYTCTCVR